MKIRNIHGVVLLVGLVCGQIGLPPGASVPTAAPGSTTYASTSYAMTKSADELIADAVLDEQDRMSGDADVMMVFDAEIYCMSGWELSDCKTKCYKIDEQEGKLSCPPGWNFTEDKQCSQSDWEPSEASCADGFELKGQFCEKIVDAPMSLVCPAGFTSTNMGCVREMEAQGTATCANGQLVNGKCHRSVESDLSTECPDGFTPRADVCERSSVSTPEPYCPSGWEINDDKCTREVRAEPTNSCGGQYAIRGADCVARATILPEKMCPEDLTWDNGVCIAIEEFQPEEVCKGRKQGGMCITEQTANAVLTCVGKASNCNEATAKSKDCPPGYSFKDKNTCLKRVEEPIEKVCPEGSSMNADGMCETTTMMEPILMCPDGTVTKTGTCEAISRANPAKSCPDGFVASGAECVATESAELSYKCNNGYFDESVGQCMILERIAARTSCNDTSSRHGDKCVENIIEDPIIQCPSGFIPEGESCVGVQKQAGTYSCKNGFSRSSSSCERSIRVEPTRLCEVGELQGTMCSVDKIEPAIIICPRAYKINPDTVMCEMRVETDSFRRCEVGEYDEKVGKCYLFAEDDELECEDDEEALLDLEIPTPAFETTTTTTTRSTTTTTTVPRTVAIKYRGPAAGKTNFVPMQTFRGNDAMDQARKYEELKMAGHVYQPVYA